MNEIEISTGEVRLVYAESDINSTRDHFVVRLPVNLTIKGDGTETFSPFAIDVPVDTADPGAAYGSLVDLAARRASVALREIADTLDSNMRAASGAQSDAE